MQLVSPESTAKMPKDEDGDTYMSSPGDGPVNLSRSVSSPDLHPCSDEEESAAAPAAPTFDRSTKPRHTPHRDMRHRDFEPIYGNVDNLSASERAWLNFTKCKESLILRLFYGQIRSTVRCVVCGKQSVTYESFSNLSLELPEVRSRCSLSDCLRLYLNGETIHGWNCPGCKEKREAVKKLDISRLPPILVIHFKRFFADTSAVPPKDVFQKKMTYIDFPLTGLDMRPFSLHAPAPAHAHAHAHAPAKHAYELYAVSNH